MAQVTTSFTVTGKENIIGGINAMMNAIEDAFMYGASFDYEPGANNVYADIENIDLYGIMCWAKIFHDVFLENSEDTFKFTIEGTVNNGYGSYTAFHLYCTQDDIIKKEYSYDIDEECSNADYGEIAEDEEFAELDAETMLSEAEEEDVDAEYDADEYAAANDAYIAFAEIK